MKRERTNSINKDYNGSIEYVKQQQISKTKQTNKYDYVIVGSGLYGCIAAYLLNKRGKKCLVVEKRDHLGGNIYCENKDNINIHKYGAHIFHTSNEIVWNFVNKFVKFNNFVNSPMAIFNNEIYNLPFNMNTFSKLWNITTPQQAKNIIDKEKSLINNPQNLEEQAISLVGSTIYNKLIKEYTEKQWGRSCKELPTNIIKRLPVRFTYNNNYFNDRYQGIPIGGYNQLINKLLKNIDYVLNTDYIEKRQHFDSICNKVIYTGRLDEFYDFKFGKLEYRTVKLETEKLEINNFQGNAVINYTSKNVPYTRIIEHKHFEPENEHYNDNITYVSKEYPAESGENSEPFYPINDNKNIALYNKYKELQTDDKYIFGGRLAEYKYYDMDDVIEKCLKDFDYKEGEE